MPRRRLTTKGRAVTGRQRLSDEMEAFLAGDDAAMTDDRLMQEIVAEKYFADHINKVEFSAFERSRLKKFEKRYEQWKLAYEDATCRDSATSCGVLKRYEILMKQQEYREQPKRAFSEAIAGLRDVPKEEEN